MSFEVGGEAYDCYMGRYSEPLAAQFAESVNAGPGQRALDVGCGPGALTAALVQRLGAQSVAAVEAVPAIRCYITSVPVTATYWEVEADSPDGAVSAASEQHPVFRSRRSRLSRLEHPLLRDPCASRGAAIGPLTDPPSDTGSLRPIGPRSPT